MEHTDVVRLPYAYPGTPRGTDFHYDGCGCGEIARPFCGHKVDWIWHPANIRAVHSALHKTGHTTFPRLRIAYFIPHHNVTGGMKMIMAQIAGLKARGHWVQAVYRSAVASPVLPSWSPIEVDSEVLLGPSDSILPVLDDVDIVMIGYFTQLLEMIDMTEFPGPIVYWDQGHEHVFGDPQAAADWDRVFHKAMQLPIVLLSVSMIIHDILMVHFSRVAPIIPNAIDVTSFRPAPLGLTDTTRPITPVTKRVLLVGNPCLPLKNHITALKALNNVNIALQGGLHVTWICQIMPAVTGLNFALECVVNPAQSELPGLYARGYDCFVFPSAYEAWGMPVLEAMASGVPVVTSRCFGVDMFCTHGENCLMVDPYDSEDMAASILQILLNPELANRLRDKALDSASLWTWENALQTLESALTQVHYLLGNGRDEFRSISAAAMLTCESHSFVEAKISPTGELTGPGIVSIAGIYAPPPAVEVPDETATAPWPTNIVTPTGGVPPGGIFEVSSPSTDEDFGPAEITPAAAHTSTSGKRRFQRDRNVTTAAKRAAFHHTYTDTDDSGSPVTDESTPFPTSLSSR